LLAPDHLDPWKPRRIASGMPYLSCPASLPGRRSFAIGGEGGRLRTARTPRKGAPAVEIGRLKEASWERTHLRTAEPRVSSVTGKSCDGFAPLIRRKLRIAQRHADEAVIRA